MWYMIRMNFFYHYFKKGLYTPRQQNGLYNNNHASIHIKAEFLCLYEFLK